mmetsp:Transcript_60629/g.196440  ORF Transcript_60629/g.196440 Transcript_60629/m.196440 type:complete len:245 (-) Transcript_60629:36-770(-)
MATTWRSHVSGLEWSQVVARGAIIMRRSWSRPVSYRSSCGSWTGTAQTRSRRTTPAWRCGGSRSGTEVGPRPSFCRAAWRRSSARPRIMGTTPLCKSMSAWRSSVSSREVGLPRTVCSRLRTVLCSCTLRTCRSNGGRSDCGRPSRRLRRPDFQVPFWPAQVARPSVGHQPNGRPAVVLEALAVVAARKVLPSVVGASVRGRTARREMPPAASPPAGNGLLPAGGRRAAAVAAAAAAAVELRAA